MTRHTGVMVSVAITLALLAGQHAATAQAPAYEVWAIDQADAPAGGARLYVWDGARLAAGQAQPAQIVNLHEAAQGVGDGPGVRPHMLALTRQGRHAIIANVATGHVQVMRATDRRLVASVDIGEQVHHAEPSPEGDLIIAANQNGKRLARLRADFTAERFSHARADDLDLAALEGPGNPDNAPICPVLVGRKAYVTLRGGGLYVVDYRATPMRVVRAYTREQVAPAGCGGVVLGDRVYINSGTAASSDLYVFDAGTDAMLTHVRLSWTGADGHGLVTTAGGRYLWMANRGQRNIVVINTSRNAVAGLIEGIGGAPDLMVASPDGRHVFVTLRGPNALTGGPSARGVSPGVGVFEITGDGNQGRRMTFAPIGDQSPASPNDPHAIALRRLP